MVWLIIVFFVVLPLCMYSLMHNEVEPFHMTKPYVRKEAINRIKRIEALEARRQYYLYRRRQWED